MREMAARTWPKSPPENRDISFLSLIRQLLLHRGPIPYAGVAVGDGRPRGLIAARMRASGLVWDVEHLKSDSREAAVELLRWGCAQALHARVRRVFFETPDDGMGAEVAERSSFQRYTQGTVYALPAGFPVDVGDSVPARPRLRSDETSLFQLYNAAVPANVRAAEALTHEEWAALYPGRKLWTPSLLGDRQDYVWELGSRVVGWMRVEFGARSQHLDLLVHPQYEAHAERMVRNALAQMSSKVPVLVDVREYQGAVRLALEHIGFLPGDAYAAWVYQLAERIAEPAIAGIRAPIHPS
jgi:hypothetical protein